ncbi:MAG: hypothetical protein WCJ30_05895 [Deltaproteobacteria bacterium]
MSRLTDWYAAPSDASSRVVRTRGLRGVLVGAGVLVAGFVLATHDTAWFHGALFRSVWVRLAFLVVALGAYLPALEGGFRLVSGLGRGAEPTTRAARAAQGLYVLVAFIGFFVVAMAMLGASAPDEAAAPVRAIGPRGLDVRLPGPNERSVRYDIGPDASIVIEHAPR